MKGLTPDSILEGLATKFMGRKVFYFPRVSSTMDVAKQMAREGAVEGTLVLTEEQGEGRGRLQRRWLAPPGTSLLFSVVLYPQPSHVPKVPMMAGLAAARAIEKVTGLDIQLKWPNDVLIKGKKIAGILAEADLPGNAPGWVILGIGININLDPQLLGATVTPATSLSAELGKDVSRLELLQRFLVELESVYLALGTGEAIHEEWGHRLETLGRHVTVRWGEETEEGWAEGVEEDGALLLRRSDGQLVRVMAGDVTLRRNS